MSTLKLPRMAQPKTRQGGAAAAAFLLLPAVAVGLVSIASQTVYPLSLWIGGIGTLLLGLVLLRFVAGRPLRSPLTGLPAAGAAIAIGLSRPVATDLVAPAVMGLLILVAASVFGAYALIATGAPALRRSRLLARKLAARKDWPADLDSCRQVPEVKELRDASRDEAAPVLALLSDSRPSVRIAALAALEFRRIWRRSQPELVLAIAQTDPQPELRAAAVLALGGLNIRLLLEELAGCLRDTSPLVRQAAADALLWDCEKRWIWVRHAVHEALADPRYTRDGALQLNIGTFSDQAISDLAAWATEAGPLGVRATQTLAQHYSHRLAERADPQLLAQLSDLVASTKAAAILRIELAGLLKYHNQLTPQLLHQLLDPANPSPLRLLAVESLLQSGNANEQVVDVLRQIARQPNRELALGAAVVVQKFLHVDLGLALGEPLPALHTRQAAEVTRRVIHWAEGSTARIRPSSHGMKKLKSSLRVPPPKPPSAPPPPADPRFAPLEWD